MRAYNLCVSGPKFTRFFCPTWESLQLMTCFSDFRCVDLFQRYSRSQSKVVRNGTKFSTGKILRVQAPKNVYENCDPCLVAHVVDKFGEVIPTGSKVIGRNTLTFAPIFEFLLPPFFRLTQILGPY